MNALPTTTYVPISCEFHSVLEDLATTRRPAEIRFTDAQGALQSRRDTLTDVYARQGAEYAVTGSGDVLRLDQLVSVGPAKRADY